MRELTVEETEMVVGGVGPGGAILGAGGAMGTAIAHDASVGETIAAGVLGGVAGYFGGIATSQHIGRGGSAMFGAYSLGTSVMAGAVGIES